MLQNNGIVWGKWDWRLPEDQHSPGQPQALGAFYLRADTSVVTFLANSFVSQVV